MAGRSRLFAQGRRQLPYLAVAAVLLAIALGLGIWLGTGSNKNKTAAAPPTSSTPAAKIVPVPSPAEVISRAVSKHTFLYPECQPVSGLRWVFPGASHFSSTLYEDFAIKYSCKTAASWIKRLIKLKIPVSKTGSLVPINMAPKGYSCGAWPDALGHAYAGGCSDPSKKSSFGWNWNVANPRVVFEYNDNNKLQKVRVGGADSDTLLIPQKNNHYQIVVQNTSGVGYIKTFTWIPPTGWTIQSITSAMGANCHLASDQVSCAGEVVPPSCLCGDNGGRVVVDMTIKAPLQGTVNGHPVYYGNEGEQTDLTSMTPLPFLIPGTRARLAKEKPSE